ncbi:MAG: DUF6941 family protein [Acidimicrobiales bacterium]
MKATMLLCDAAQVAEGKLYVLGGGWSMIGPEPTPSAIALKVEVGWAEAASAHHWELYLVDEDGEEIVVETVEGPRPVEVRGDFQVGRPVGLPEGSPVDVSLAVNLGPLPLSPGRRFAWKLTIDGVSDPDWMLAFTTRPAPAGSDAVPT